MMEEGKNFGYTAMVSQGVASKPVDWNDTEGDSPRAAASPSGKKGRKSQAGAKKGRQTEMLLKKALS